MLSLCRNDATEQKDKHVQSKERGTVGRAEKFIRRSQDFFLKNRDGLLCFFSDRSVHEYFILYTNFPPLQNIVKCVNYYIYYLLCK